MTKPVTILYNSRASQWTSHRANLTRLSEQTAAELVPLDDANHWLDSLNGEDAGRTIVFGGDGTISRVINTVDQHHRLDTYKFGILPGGTGNDFARSLGIPMHSLAKAMKVATDEGELASVDVIEISNGSRSLLVNAATAGFGGFVTGDLVEEDKRRWGAMAYWVAAFSKIVSLPSYSIQVRIDDGAPQSFEVFGLAVASGRFVGGGFPVAPAALVNDGLMNITIVPVMPVGQLLACGVDFTLGHPHKSSPVVCLTGRSFHIESDPELPFSLDGETERTTHAHFRIRPSAFKVFHAHGAPALSHSSS